MLVFPRRRRRRFRAGGAGGVKRPAAVLIAVAMMCSTYTTTASCDSIIASPVLIIRDILDPGAGSCEQQCGHGCPSIRDGDPDPDHRPIHGGVGAKRHIHLSALNEIELRAEIENANAGLAVGEQQPPRQLPTTVSARLASLVNTRRSIER